ncbi:TIGR03885 family FMN-dependent LLM class oxidoreductase [Deinococcus yavapaiensis]|uniref:Putative non-F420 flavinoid oxidoreductase n=1 Tax=Deinococcus yavapaiensis KR-236 TaxID=694435 RepID=A0A318S3W3_9DEIO|nr:TIGR03885 family FMN-dependent LLM class oxidoreductase [Deinococcus yavapaiensis]PYE52750.1 putative non-F420 flavinoid oxidoreductase [Deinococcus yavapaiensis KR-236]
MKNVLIGYHASHEQFSPRELLRLVGLAEQAGFGAAMCSDHFNPWSERQGESGFAWSWLGAALASTNLSFGMVNAPGQRYHPALVAQAAATLAQMFPSRLWCAFGSGQFLNEHVTGARWPTKSERNRRLREAVEVMRALWRGETVTHRGEFFTVEEAYLYTRPEEPPRVYGAALSEETARFVGGWADGLITVNTSAEKLRGIVDAFRAGGGEGKPMSVQVHVASNLEEALDQWSANVFESRVLSDLKRPDQFDALARFVRPDDLSQAVRISADAEQHAAWLQEDLELGFDRIYLHGVGRDQERFIETFAAHVLPQVTANAP